MEEQGARGGVAQGEQEVPRDHIGQKTDGQSHRPHDEVGQELDGDDEDPQGLRHARGQHGAAQEAAQAVTLDTGVEEDNVGHHGEDDRHADDAGGGDIEAGNDAGDIEEEHAQENRGDDGHVRLGAPLADDLLGDIDPGEAEKHLAHVLEAPGDHLGARSANTEEEHESGSHDQTHHHDAIDLERGPHEQEGLGEEIGQGGRLETLTAPGGWSDRC